MVHLLLLKKKKRIITKQTNIIQVCVNIIELFKILPYRKERSELPQYRVQTFFQRWKINSLSLGSLIYLRSFISVIKLQLNSVKIPFSSFRLIVHQIQTNYIWMQLRSFWTFLVGFFKDNLFSCNFKAHLENYG